MVFKDGLLYLASPYSHEASLIRRERFIAACEASTALIKQGWLIFSPIVHSVPLHIYTNFGFKWDDWKDYDLKFVSYCDSFAVLKLAGWEESIGVQAELKYAKDYRKRLFSVDPDTFKISEGI